MMTLSLAFALAALGGTPEELPRTLLLQEEAKPAQEPAPAPAPQQAPAGDGQKFLDFDRLEGAARIGMAAFSEDFEADPEVSFGIHVRAPMPWLSRDLFGLEEDDFGGFLEFTISSIDRDGVDPPLEEPDGTLFFVAAGLDYTFYRDQTFMVLGQLGLQYGSFGGVTDTDDGIALLVGVLGGVEIADGFNITLNPQAGFADAGDHVFFINLGLHIEF